MLLCCRWGFPWVCFFFPYGLSNGFAFTIDVLSLVLLLSSSTVGRSRGLAPAADVLSLGLLLSSSSSTAGHPMVSRSPLMFYLWF